HLAGEWSGGERRLQIPAPVGDERPQVGTAHAALACAGTGEGGPLHELQLPESSFPHRIEVLHCHACARTHDTPIRTARNRSALGRGPDPAYLASPTHASA